MTVIECDTCHSPVHCYEGERGVLRGVCSVCGRGYGGARSVDTGYSDAPVEEKKKERIGFQLWLNNGFDDPNPLFIHCYRAYWMAHDSKDFYMTKYGKKYWKIVEVRGDVCGRKGIEDH